MKHNTKAILINPVPVGMEGNKEDTLTEFDYQMINEMKKIKEIGNWSDEELKQYCLVLRNYTQIIYHVANKQNSNDYNVEKNSSKLPAILTSTFLYQNSILKNKILA